MNGQEKQGAMDKSVAEKPDYGNWVPKRFIYIPGAVTLLFLGLSFAFLALIVVAVFFFLVSV
jgi:hypothetical protein